MIEIMGWFVFKKKQITSHWSERVPQDTFSDEQYFEISKSYVDGFRELARSLGFELLGSRESPLGATFWDRLAAVFEEDYSSDLTLEQIRAAILKHHNDSEQFVYYTVRNDFQMSREAYNDIAHWNLRTNFDDVDVLVYDFNCRSIWKELSQIFEDFENDR